MAADATGLLKNMKLILILVAGMVLFSGNVFAEQTGMFPNVKESKLSYPVYQAVYENQGSSKDVPKIIVFSRAGECVGVADGNTLAADKITDFIKDSLRKNHKACDAVVSSHFGALKPGSGAGTGKSEVVLVVLDVPFCKACDDFKIALLQASHNQLADMHLSIVSVVLDKKS